MKSLIARPPALGLLEIASLTRGLVVADALVKKAPVRLLDVSDVSPGKSLVLFEGQVADVQEAMAEGERVAAPHLIDRLFLPYADAQLAPAINGKPSRGLVDALGIVETLTAASALRAADAAVKAADTRLFRLRLARGIGGKATFTLTGTQSSIEAALEAGCAVVGDGLLVDSQMIARPHPEFLATL